MAIAFRPDPLQAAIDLGLQYSLTTFNFQAGATTTALILPPRAGRIGAVLSYTRSYVFPVFRGPGGNTLPLQVGSEGWTVVSSAAFPWLLEGVSMTDAPSGQQRLTVVDQWIIY